MSKILKSKVGLILVLIILAGAGFFIWSRKDGQKNEFTGYKLIEKQLNKVAALENEEIMITIGKSSQFTGEKRDPRIPQTVPDEFLYPGASVQAVQQYANRGATLVLATEDKLNVVKDVMMESLADNGWEKTRETESELEYKLGEQKALIIFEDSDKYTLLTVSLTFK